MCGRYYIETEDTLSVQGAIRLAGFENGADCVNRPSNGFAVRRVRRYKSSICNRLVALCAPCVSSTCRQQAFVLRPCPRRFQFPGRSKGVFRRQAAFMRSAKGRLAMAIVNNRRA